MKHKNVISESFCQMLVVIPIKTNNVDKKWGPLYNTEIWSDYKISAGSARFTWISLLTSTFHLRIVTHKEPRSPYPMWSSYYLSVHRKKKKEWRNVATCNHEPKIHVIQVSRKTKGCCSILQRIMVYLHSRVTVILQN